MSNTDLKRLMLAIIVVGSGLYGFWYYKNNTDDYLASQESFSAPPEPEPVVAGAQDLNPGSDVSNLPAPAKPEIQPADIAVTPPIDHEKLYLAQQKALKDNFQNTIKLHMNLPENMNFHEMDLDENVVGLFGREMGSSKKFAIMATTEKPSVESVVNYLNETRKANPMLQDREFKISGKVLTFPPPANSGLGTVTIIPAGEDLYAAFVQRSDKKGSYLFMMEASPSYFENNDDGFELLLNSVKLDF